MTNSFILGLTHGVLYGLTPTLVLVVGLDRYLIEGRDRGRLAYVGTIIGQLLFLSLPLFGWKHLLWVWYYCEPFLLFTGMVLVLGLCHNNWHASRFLQGYLGTSQGGSSYRVTNSPLLPGEPIYQIGVQICLMFCCPVNPYMLQSLLATVPNNKFLYLFAFTLGYAPLVLVIWDFMGQKLEKYIRESGQVSVRRMVAKTLAMAMSFGLLAQFGNGNWQVARYPTDNIFVYTPFKIMRTADLSHMDDHIYTREENAEFRATATPYELEQSLKKEKIALNMPNYGSVGNSRYYLPVGDLGSGWDTDRQLVQVNEDRSLELDLEDESRDSAAVRLETLYGYIRVIERFRLFALNAFYLPEWERISDMDRIDDLYKMRRELDEQLAADPNIYRVFRRLPQHRFVGDFRARPVDDEDPTKLVAPLSTHPEAMYGVEHTLRDSRLDGGYAKVHELPSSVRLPWHFPAIPEPEGYEEAALASDFLVTPDRPLTHPDYKSSFEEGSAFLIPKSFLGRTPTTK